MRRCFIAFGTASSGLTLDDGINGITPCRISSKVGWFGGKLGCDCVRLRPAFVRHHDRSHPRSSTVIERIAETSSVSACRSFSRTSLYFSSVCLPLIRVLALPITMKNCFHVFALKVVIGVSDFIRVSSQMSWSKDNWEKSAVNVTSRRLSNFSQHSASRVRGTLRSLVLAFEIFPSALLLYFLFSVWTSMSESESDADSCSSSLLVS